MARYWQQSKRLLSDYLQRRFFDFGLVAPVQRERPTLYAWRRAAGTKIQRQYGLYRTRQFMHHAANSASFENAYDIGIEDLDVVGIALSKDAGIEKELEQDSAVVYRVEREFINKEVFLSGVHFQ